METALRKRRGFPFVWISALYGLQEALGEILKQCAAGQCRGYGKCVIF
jgi:hypothetical protein